MVPLTTGLMPRMRSRALSASVALVTQALTLYDLSVSVVALRGTVSLQPEPGAAVPQTVAIVCQFAPLSTLISSASWSST
jgi:hypothetical protein